jgi:alanyl-tRNA synthetase
MKSRELRKSFLDFFVSKGHCHITGSSIVPAGDNTLLFTNAGMNQFKDIFLAKETASYKTATTAQRCIRAGGKHNDLSNVGFTKRHLTCFEMLGNFSFGDYFKEAAISYAWEFLTKTLSINPDLLWVTVFNNDDEAYEIWKNIIGIPEHKIIRLGEKDNFWQMGDIGPCGPCSEIYIDRGIHSEIDTNAKPGDDQSTRFLEIWNLVFMQYNRNQTGTLEPLTQTGVDTGMGLERLALVMQHVDSVFETDAFTVIINEIKKHIKTTSIHDNIGTRVIADHIRSSCAIMAEGIAPSNEGRGYVLRKILRRALLFAHKLGNSHIVHDIIPFFLSSSDALFDDLKTHIQFIQEHTALEHERFSINLEHGTKRFYEMAEKEKNKTLFSGINAFTLYDTFGFPLEAIEVLAQEKGMTIDFQQYDAEMKQQRERSKAESHFTMDIKNITIPHISTHFTGYETLSDSGCIKGIIHNNILVENIPQHTHCYIISDKSPFYAPSGGQCADKGIIIFNNQIITVTNVIKIQHAICLEIVTLDSMKIGDCITQEVNPVKRQLAGAHHTATHLLQASLRKIYGDSIKQAGSSVSPECLTLDVSINSNIDRDTMIHIETLMNQKISEAIPVITKQMTFDEAVKEGALAFFTEKYNKDHVRMVTINSFSKELCGGTHAKNTRDLGCFILTEVSSVASGIKRFTGKVSTAAHQEYSIWHDAMLTGSQLYKSTSHALKEALIKNHETTQELRKHINCLELRIVKEKLRLWQKEIKEKNGISYGFFELEHDLIPHMRSILQSLQGIIKGIYILFSYHDNKTTIQISIDPHLTTHYNGKVLLSKICDVSLFKGKTLDNMIVGVIETKIRIDTLDTII